MKTTETSSNAIHQDVVLERLVGFIDLLRDENFLCDTTSSFSATEAFTAGYLEHRLFLKEGLRTCLCHSRSEWRQFDDLFDFYWRSTKANDDDDTAAPSSSNNQPPEDASRNRMIGFSASSDEQDLDQNITGAGDFKTLSLADFRFVFDQHQMQAIEHLIDSLAKQLRRQRRRRLKAARHGGQLDMRRSQQKALSTAGTLRELAYRKPIKRLPTFVLLLDVSQSMEVYSKLFLRFTRQLMSEFDRSTAYAFNTQLFELGKGSTRLREQDFETAMNQYSKGWLGGTRIADSFATFNNDFSRHTIDAQSTVVVFSDGYDTAKLDRLIPEVEAIKRKAKRLIWVNPLLGRFAENEPDPRMDCLKPYLDVYCSGHNLEALEKLGTHLLR